MTGENMLAIPEFEPRMLIGGRLVPARSGAVFDNIDPFTERVIGVSPDADVDDVDAAIDAARTAADAGTWAEDHAFRSRCLLQLHAALDAHREELRALLVSEVGCPISMTRALMLDGPLQDVLDQAEVAKEFRYTYDLPQGHSGAPGARTVWRRPVGVVSAISPYNYPLHSLVIKTVPALAAGNTVVTKPSPLTPWTAALIGKLIAEETDIPAGVFNVITSQSVSAAERLVSHPAVDMVTFTGSTTVGRQILRSAADTVKKSIMELGGKSASIILPDADAPSAIEWGLRALYRHAGQGCTKLTRILLPRSRYEEGVAAAVAVTEAIPWGDPWDERTLMGPVISATHCERVLGYIEKGISDGGRLVAGGGRPDRPQGYFVEPTLFADVAPDHTIAQEEIFGPVAAIIPYETEDEAVRIANGTIFGLSSAVWSSSPERAMQVARRLRAGTTTINGAYWHGNDTPFGGVKESGIGREQGVVGFEEFLDYQVVGHPPT
jgi:aldehyde dehydrogenase (NAD+)